MRRQPLAVTPSKLFLVFLKIEVLVAERAGGGIGTKRAAALGRWETAKKQEYAASALHAAGRVALDEAIDFGE